MEYDYTYERPKRRRIPAVEQVSVPPKNPRWGVACFQVKTNVTLNTLFEQVHHDDPEDRKHAFEGINDHLTIRWGLINDKNIEKTIIDKFCCGIIDSDEGVRKAACRVLRIRQRHYGTKIEDYLRTLVIPSVMEALTHSETGIHLTGKDVINHLLERIPSCLYIFVRKSCKSLRCVMKNEVPENRCSHIRMLRILQSINACLKLMPSVDEIFFDGQSLAVLKSVLSNFPLPRNWIQDSYVVEDSNNFDLDIEVTKIFFRLPKLSDNAQFDKFIAFFTNALYQIPESNLAELLAFFPSHIPQLLPKLSNHSQSNLIQAFTVAFKRSDPESEFKYACVSVMKWMLQEDGVIDVHDEAFRMCVREWIEDLCTWLPTEKSKGVLVVLLTALKFTNIEGLENHLLTTFCWLFRGSAKVPYDNGGLFHHIPNGRREECLRALNNFPVLDEVLLQSLATACVSCNMKHLPEITKALRKFNRSKKTADDNRYLHFFALVVAEIEDCRGNSTSRGLKKSDIGKMDVIFSQFRKIRFYADELSNFPSVSNYHSQYAVLRLIAKLDDSLEKSPPEFVALVSNFTPGYLFKVMQLDEDETGTRNHYLLPCFDIMIGNTKFCSLIMDEIMKHVKAQSGPEGLDTIIAVANLLAIMRSNAELVEAMDSLENKLFDSRVKSCLFSFKSTLDDDFESLPMDKYHKLCLVLQQI